MRVRGLRLVESSSVFDRDGVLQWSGLAPRLAHLPLETYAQGQECPIHSRFGRRYHPHHLPVQGQTGISERYIQVLRHVP